MGPRDRPGQSGELSAGALGRRHRRGSAPAAVAVALAILIQGTGRAGAPGAESAEAEVQRLIEFGRSSDAAVVARSHLAEVESRHGPDALETAEAIDLLVSALSRVSGRAPAASDLALAQRAVAIKEAAVGQGLPEVARSLGNLSHLLRRAGDLAGARVPVERAIEIRETRLGLGHPETTASVRSLAALLGAVEGPAAARRFYEEAIVVRERALGADHPAVADLLQTLAGLLVTTAPAEAKALQQRALDVREKIVDPEDASLGPTLKDLAFTHWMLGEYREARALFERALAIQERAELEHARTVDYLEHLAVLLYEMGDYEPALELIERAVPLAERVFGPNHVNYAQALDFLAYARMHFGEYDVARRLVEQALTIKERSPDSNEFWWASSLLTLADLLQRTGDLAGARERYERGLDIWSKSKPDTDWEYMGYRHSYASLLAKSGENAAALAIYERLLALREKVWGADHPAVGATLADLARLLAATGERGRALELALRAERIGGEHLRLTAGALPEAQALRYGTVRPVGLDLAHSLIVRDPASASRREVLDALIRSRAAVLDEMAGRQRLVVETGELAGLSAELRRARERLAYLILRGQSGPASEGYRDVLAVARQERERAERRLAEVSVAFREERSRVSVGLAEVARALPPRSALVAYTRYEHLYTATPEGAEDGRPVIAPSYLAWILRSGAPEPVAVSLGSAGTIDALVEEWRECAGAEPRSAEEDCRPPGTRLRQAIWEPLAAELQDMRRVFVVPDGALNLVSFAGLPGGEGGYLVEADLVIHRLSAERDIVVPESPPHLGRGLLAIGGPAYDDARTFAALRPVEPERARPDPTVAVASRRGQRRSGCAGFQSLRFGPLPGAQREAREVVALWRKGGPPGSDAAARAALPGASSDALELTAAAASEAAFKQHAPGRKVLHLATHGFFLGSGCSSALEATRGVGKVVAAGDAPPPLAGENPLLLSGLVLAGANHRVAASADEEDGILTAEEIAALDLSGVEWAVLSACDTGLGQIKAGEGVFGLLRAFHVAGVKTLIMSLWSVEDNSARAWMRALYSARLIRRLDTAEAVREASLKVLSERRAKKQSTHPFYWAGFVAAGDWR